MHRIYSTAVNDVYVHYIAKAERKGQDPANVDVVIRWLTGYSAAALKKHLKNGTTFRDFFDGATINPNAELITGKICGVTIQEIEDPLMKQIRYLDKLVDEVANGRAMEKILRK
jgi:hypothetical protein